MIMNKPTSILFLCVANSARSQMAEGLAKSLFPNDTQIYSAGSNPSGQVHPLAIYVLNEQGVDISSNKSKSIHDLPDSFLKNLDFVITLCAEEICPVLPTKAKRVHWPIPDPAAAKLDQEIAFRMARNQIEEHLIHFNRQFINSFSDV